MRSFGPPRDLKLFQLLGVSLTVALGVACASAPSRHARPEPGVAPADRELAETPGLRQSLYRLTYDGGEGRTSLKVVVRESVSERFQITVSDVAGRRVWSLDHAPQRVVLVDHRAGSFCVSGPSLSLPDVHPQELPLAAIPRLLAGLFPLAEESTRQSDEWVDAEGRQWRQAREDGVLQSWSLLDSDGPALWWSRESDGGILSRRGGEQYRWRLIVREDAVTALGDVVPEGFAEGVCDDQDLP